MCVCESCVCVRLVCERVVCERETARGRRSGWECTTKSKIPTSKCEKKREDLGNTSSRNGMNGF